MRGMIAQVAFRAVKIHYAALQYKYEWYPSMGNIENIHKDKRGLNQGRVLLVEDDAALQSHLADLMANAGFSVITGGSTASLQQSIRQFEFAFILVDIRLPDGNGLDTLALCRQTQPHAKLIVMSGFGSLASAILAMKNGAHDFLEKPFAAERLLNSLLLRQPTRLRLPERPMSPRRRQWEHIHRTYEQCGRNASQTASLLGLHRQTVARLIAKPPPTYH